MPKFVILSGSIIKAVRREDGSTKHVHEEGSTIELSADEAAHINRKGKKLEPVELRDAKAKAEADSKATIARAEADAKTKAEAAKQHKGGGK